MTGRIDLNCDMGESFGAWKMGVDDAIMPFITSVNIACGFHAGDPGIMRHTVECAIRHGVAIGAHPGFPDLAGFGRRDMNLSPQEVRDLVLYQMGALSAFAVTMGTRLHHVKAHGALYNRAAKDAMLASAIAEAVHQFDPTLIYVGLANTDMIRTAENVGLRVAREVFADRTYQPDGSLTSRKLPDAMVTDAKAAAARVIRMTQEGKVRAEDGSDLTVQADTVCIHGDSPEALEFARAIRTELDAAGIEVRALG